MGIIQSFIDRKILNYLQSKQLGLVSATDHQGWISMFGGDQQNILKEDYRSFVYSSITTRAEKVRESTLRLYKQQGNGKKKEIEKHPFIDFTNSINIYDQSFGTIKFLISANLDLFGNAFVYYLRNMLGLPVMQFVLPGNKVTLNFNEQKNQVVSYTYFNGTQRQTYTRQEILHIKLPTPHDPFIGKSTCSAIRSAINTDWYQSIYNENFYKNDAAIGLTLEYPGKLGKDVFDRLERQIEAKYSGYANAGKHLILEGGKSSRINATPREAQFMQSRLNLRDEIFGVFKTNKSIMGYTDDVNRANAEAANAGFIINAIAPFAKNISEAYSVFVKTNYDERLYTENDFDLQRDPAEVRADKEQMLKYKAMSINELRESYSYTPIAGGDVYPGESQQSNDQNNNDQNNNDQNNNQTETQK